MIVLFYALGKTLFNITNLRDLGVLFYATSLGLVIIYILFYLKFKASIHMLSFGVSIAFFIVLSNIYSQSLLLLIIILFFLTGILASSRLYLKAHKPSEIYVGFFIGIITTFCLQYFL